MYITGTNKMGAHQRQQPGAVDVWQTPAQAAARYLLEADRLRVRPPAPIQVEAHEEEQNREVGNQRPDRRRGDEQEAPHQEPAQVDRQTEGEERDSPPCLPVVDVTQAERDEL